MVILSVENKINKGEDVEKSINDFTSIKARKVKSK